jgi:hypothetical protein
MATNSFYMKPVITLFLLAFVLASCTIENVEPRFDPRDRIVGAYDVEEYSETFNDYTYYSLRVSKSHYADEIYLNNFYALDIRVYATLDYDRIDIPFQVVDGYEIEGVGTIHGNELELSYRVKDRYGDSHADYCETRARFDY